jgi:hypothetical protein
MRTACCRWNWWTRHYFQDATEINSSIECLRLIDELGCGPSFYCPWSVGRTSDDIVLLVLDQSDIERVLGNHGPGPPARAPSVDTSRPASRGVGCGGAGPSASPPPPPQLAAGPSKAIKPIYKLKPRFCEYFCGTAVLAKAFYSLNWSAVRSDSSCRMTSARHCLRCGVGVRCAQA